MARAKSSHTFEYEVKEILGDVTPTEDLKAHTVKRILRSLWHHDGQVEEGIDIRKCSVATNAIFGGIRLTIEEAHSVCDILLDKGYGSTDAIERAYEKRIGRFAAKKGTKSAKAIKEKSDE